VKYNVYIAEDEKFARLGLVEMFEILENWQVIGDADNGLKALKDCMKRPPNLLITDIHMPLLTGIELAQELINENLSIKIIFLTAYDNYALDAFKLNAIDYVLKPIETSEFYQCIDSIEKQIADEVVLEKLTTSKVSIQKLAQVIHDKHYQDKIIVKSIGRIDILLTQDIYSIESCGNYLNISTKNATILHRQTMKSIEKSLNPQYFIRVHRTMIVAIKKIRSILRENSVSYIVLHNNKKVKISVNLLKKVKESVQKSHHK
jgi:two-component system LytT family response regulator